MKILALSDLHGDQALFDAIVRHADTVEVVVLAGDLLERRRGDVTVREGQRECGDILTRTLEAVTCPVLYIMGNDDMVVWDPPRAHFRHIHGERVEVGAWNFVGYQYSLPFMGGIHEKPEAEVAADLAAIEPLIDGRTVLVTHMPAFGILDRTSSGLQVGSPSLRDMIRRTGPRAHIHGHIHAAFGRTDASFNVACGAVRIDLEDLRSEVLLDARGG